MRSKLRWRITNIICIFLISSVYSFSYGSGISYLINQKQQKISGKVTDDHGNALIGVTVAIKGTTIGTITNNDGSFTIQADIGQTIVFSFIGYQTKEVKYEGQNNLVIELNTSSTQLNEVVAIGYGTQKKISLTGSISTIQRNKLEKNAVGNVTDALQGNAPGVNVVTSNLPGNNAKIRIRGLGTINNNAPLWIIDGVPSTGGLDGISPAEIQSISVLKDAASTAIYGARGANGVILVTTLQGKKSQAPQVNFSARFGIAKNTSKYDLLNVKEYGEMLWLQAKNSGIAPHHPYYGSGTEPQTPKYLLPAGANEVDLSLYNIKTFPITEANLNGTDWYSKIFKPGTTQQYDVSVTGGSENTTYAFTAGILNEGGIVKLTGFKRYSLSANVNTSFNTWLDLGENLRLAYTNDWGLQQQGESGSAGIIPQLTAIMPVYDIRGNYAPLSRLNGFDPLANPIGDLERGKDFTRENLLLDGNIHATISILKNIKLKSLFGFTIRKGYEKSPLEANPDSYQARSFNRLTEYSDETRLWDFTNTINYTKTFNDNHHFEILLGTEAISDQSHNFSATRTKFLLITPDYWVLNAGEGDQTNSGTASDWTTFSYFGRIHYGYKYKYLIDAVFRRDGSSRFGPNHRYGNFPSVAAAWVVSEENFFKDERNWLDFLKMRASWGQSGNDQIGNYNGFTTFSTDLDHASYPLDGSNNNVVSGFQSLAFGNPDAQWETTTSINLGIDATFLNRIDLTIDLWKKNTTNMLYPKGIPSVFGQAHIPSVNIGDMKNTGIDFQLNFRNSSLNKNLKYNLALNISHYKNEIVKLSNVAGEAIIGNSYRGNIYTRAETGTSFPEFYGYKVLGIFQSEEEAKAHAPAFGDYNAPGHFIFADINSDGVINDEDRTYIGDPHPDFIAGLSGNIQYKQFDLSASFYSSIGNDIVNAMRRSLDFNFFQWNRSKRRLYKSWGSPYLIDNKNAEMPIAELNDATDMLPSTYFIENGSYLRLQSVQLGYNLSKRLSKMISLKSCRIYIMATNLFTLTNYSGLDPQINTSDNTFGIDYGIWPTPKRFLIGINISL